MKEEEKKTTADETQVMSFAKFLTDKGVTVSYVAPDEKKAEYSKNIDDETRRILNTEMLINGVKQTPAQYIAQAQVAFVMDNPNPLNVGSLRKNIGDDVVNVNVGGVGIEKFLESVAPDGDEDGEEE